MKKTLLTLSIPFICFSIATGQNGTLDNSYNLNGIVTTATSLADDIGNSVVVQSDGKIIIVGTSDNGADYTIIRYNSDGSVDNTFGTNGIVTADINGSSDEAEDVALQSDGKIIIVGTTYYSFSDTYFVARYNSDGTIDNSFGTNGVTLITSETGQAHSVSIQTDGKIIIVGDINNGNREIMVCRVTSSGILDTSFGSTGSVITANTSSLFGTSSAIQTDGKIIVGGYMSVTPSDYAIIRYNTDGSLDTSFGTTGIVTTDVNTNSLDNSYTIAIQSDGKILQGGYVDNGSAQYDFGIIRYNSNGSIDTSYGTNGVSLIDINNNSIDYGRDMLLLPNGKLVVAGYVYNSGADFALITLLTDGSIDNSFGTNGKVFTDIGGSWDKAYSVALTSDNNIVVGGYSNVNGDDEFTTVRYLSEYSTGVIDFSVKSNSTLVFPNPILHSTTIEYSLNKNEIFSMDVTDINGKIVKSIFNNTQKQKGVNQERIDLSQLPVGIYILRLYNNSHQTHIQMIKK